MHRAGASMPYVLLLGSVAAVGVAAAAPRDPGLVAAVFPPWWSAAEALSAASGAGNVVGPGGKAFVLVIRGGADLPARVRAAGGLAVDPAVAGLCFGRSRGDV